MTCSIEHRHTISYSPVVVVQVPCFREVDDLGRHRGDHQGWLDSPERVTAGKTYPADRRLVSWDRGSSVTHRVGDGDDWESCPICGALSPPVDGDRTGWRFPGAHDAFRLSEETLGGACGQCRTWVERVHQFTQGWQAQSPKDRRTWRLVRQDGSSRLQAWQNGITGAYGDRWFKVEWHDGDTAGPQSSLWDSGEIPWWLDDQFPPNAVATATGRK